MATKLTPEQEIEAQEYIDANNDPDKVLAKKIHTKYKDNRKPKSGLMDITAYTAKINAGNVKSRRRTVDGYEETIATVDEVDHFMRLDRPWTEPILNDVLAGLRCPSTLELHSDKFGVEDAN